LLIAAAVGLLAPACRARTGDHALPSPDAPTVLLFGDSITRGHGVQAGEAYPSLLQRKINNAGLDYRCVNAGISGETTAGGLARVRRFASEPPALVLVELGTNDVLRGINRRHTYDNLVGIVAGFQEMGAHVVLAGVLLGDKHPAFDKSMGRMYEAVAHHTGASLIANLLVGVAGIRELNLEDGIHPNAAGQKLVAKTAWKYLEPMLADRERASR